MHSQEVQIPTRKDNSQLALRPEQNGPCRGFSKGHKVYPYKYVNIWGLLGWYSYMLFEKQSNLRQYCRCSENCKHV